MARSTPERPRPDRGRDAIRDLGPWFHNLHLPDGTQTAPDHALGDFPSYIWQRLAPHLPEDLSGWTALDIGCNAGFYAFELARRGATVTGIDADPRYLRQARWAAARMGLEERVSFSRMQVYDLAGSERRFDLVLFMGVLYHLRYPLLGLDIVARTVGRRLVVQTLTMPGEEELNDTVIEDMNERDAMAHPGWPKLAFLEHHFACDPTNWWAPNHAAVMAMLRSSGMRVSDRPHAELYLCEPDPASPSAVHSWDADEFLAATGTGAPRDPLEPR